MAQFGGELAAMCGLVADAMERVTRALLETDLALAEQVITGDAEIDAQGARCEQHACALLALQAPVVPATAPRSGVGEVGGDHDAQCFGCEGDPGGGVATDLSVDVQG